MKLFYDPATVGRMSLGTLAGTAKTNAAGAWVMNGSFIAAEYYAKVLPLVIHSNGATINCKLDLSIQMRF